MRLGNAVVESFGCGELVRGERLVVKIAADEQQVFGCVFRNDQHHVERLPVIERIIAKAAYGTHLRAD